MGRHVVGSDRFPVCTKGCGAAVHWLPDAHNLARKVPLIPATAELGPGPWIIGTFAEEKVAEFVGPEGGPDDRPTYHNHFQFCPRWVGPGPDRSRTAHPIQEVPT